RCLKRCHLVNGTANYSLSRLIHTKERQIQWVDRDRCCFRNRQSGIFLDTSLANLSNSKCIFLLKTPKNSKIKEKIKKRVCKKITSSEYRAFNSLSENVSIEKNSTGLNI
ncbi:hypothetical protein BpHYR1_031860, partial [Brachionus plicatilis]